MNSKDNELYVLNVRAKLKSAGFDFNKANEIAEKVCAVYLEYGDCPEIALSMIAVGYNSKCMANQDMMPIKYNEDHKNIDGAMSEAQINAYNKTSVVQFSIINDIAENEEHLVHEVISSWRS